MTRVIRNKHEKLETFRHYSMSNFGGDHTIFGEHESDLAYEHMGRLFERDSKKYKTAMEAARECDVDERSAMFFQEFLRHYTGIASINVKHIKRCDVRSSGQCILLLGYTHRRMK